VDSVCSYTNGEISRYAALFSAAAILLVLEYLGGLRGVAYTDVVQGIALLIGSIVFFIVQHVVRWLC
jgi:SSS family solute:Na+ symporter